MNENVKQWLLNGERGVSSDVIVATLENIKRQSVWSDTHPSDSSDFNRCVKLLDAVPEYRFRLDELREVSPPWNVLVEHWDELEALLHEEELTGCAPKLYDRMKELGC